MNELTAQDVELCVADDDDSLPSDVATVATVPHRGPHDLLKAIGRAAIDAMADLPECCTSEQGIVYVIEAGGLAKIGWSSELPKRLAGLQASCPVPIRLLAVGRGPTMLERALHMRFSGSRRHGEWFTVRPVKEWLRSLDRDLCVTCADRTSPYWTPPRPRTGAR